MSVQSIRPTDLPAGHRRTVHVDVSIPRPVSVAAVFRAAARVLAANGLHQGDYFPDALSDKTTPYELRPLSVPAALRCAVTGDPRVGSPLAEAALVVLGDLLAVDDRPPYVSTYDLENFVDDWADAEGRTTESAVAVLYAAADDSERVAA